MRRVCPLIGVTATALTAPAALAQTPDTLTPDGPATITSTFSGMQALNGYVGPRVLVAWRATVGPGSHADTVRPRLETPDGQQILGDPVQLPADPGTYTFPAPHLNSVRLAGIDQQRGGLALEQTRACAPAFGRFGDPCQIWSVDVYKGDPPPGITATPDDHVAGASLAIDTVWEGDRDSDGRGDQTEDRTDLKVSTRQKRDAAGDLRIDVTATNNGPLAADIPAAQAQVPADMKTHWATDCKRGQGYFGASTAATKWTECVLAAIQPGQTRTATLVLNRDATGKVGVDAVSEGPDLNAQDNTTSLDVTPLPELTLVAAKRQTLTRGIQARVQLARPGRARLTATFRAHGRVIRVARTVKLPAAEERTVTLRPHGPLLRSLRRALARGTLTGTLVARRIGGPPLASAPISLG